VIISIKGTLSKHLTDSGSAVSSYSAQLSDINMPRIRRPPLCYCCVYHFNIQVYSVKQGKKRRPLRHGSNFGLPVTCAKFYPFNSNFLITTGINSSAQFDEFVYIHD
jgi:hypothetical protein